MKLKIKLTLLSPTVALLFIRSYSKTAPKSVQKPTKSPTFRVKGVSNSRATHRSHKGSRSRGDTIVYDLTNQHVSARGSKESGERVTTIFNPNKQSEKEQPETEQQQKSNDKWRNYLSSTSLNHIHASDVSQK